MLVFGARGESLGISKTVPEFGALKSFGAWFQRGGLGVSSP